MNQAHLHVPEDQSRPYRLEGSQADPSLYPVLMVSDTGTGMSADTLDGIFELFFTAKAVGEGTGLGSATADGIVTGCDAQIAAETTLGPGSTFRVYFPAADHPLRGAGKVDPPS